MSDKTSISEIVLAVIAETFSVDRSCISRATNAADVDGWDSLGHTVLMVRLERRLGMRISERVAAKADCVGVLIDLLRMEASAEAETAR